MKKQSIILISSALVLVLTAFKVISAEDSAQTQNDKSVAWYVANIREAKATNQQCHDSPEQQRAANCENALHALKISFKGGN